MRALVAYGAGVAAVLQGTDMVFAALALPDLAYRIIVIAAIAGFPLVAVLAWVYDLTAQGLRRASDVTPEEGRAPHAGQGEAAEALLSSLVPPTTWLGTVTVRALYELGVLEADRGDAAAATDHFRRLLSMLEDPGPAAASWAERARTNLAALPPR